MPVTRPTPKPKPRPSAPPRPSVDRDKILAKAAELRTHGRHCELIADLLLASMGLEAPEPASPPAQP